MRHLYVKEFVEVCLYLDIRDVEARSTRSRSQRSSDAESLLNEVLLQVS